MNLMAMKSYLLFLFNMSAVEQVVYQPPAEAWTDSSVLSTVCTK